MIARDRALAELTAEPFDVVVIGGGVTGAGVALDAASRGYSTAIVERADWAIGTSSRSSKMVHGGLRYLQNFDLGLVREALLERQLMVHLAPHLVYPTPYLVPTLGDDRRDVKIGIGLNMYDVMATTRVGQGRRQRSERPGRRERDDENGAEPPPESWSPDRHRTIPAEEAVELIPALEAAGPEVRLPLLRLPDRRRPARPDDPRRGRALRRGDGEPARGHLAARARRPGRGSGLPRCRERRRPSRSGRPTSSTRPASGRTGSDPARSLDETEVPRISPSRGTHVTLPLELLPLDHAACIVPAGARPHDLRPALVRAGPRRHDRQRLRRRHRPRAPRRRRRRVPARRGQLATSARRSSATT